MTKFSITEILKLRASLYKKWVMKRTLMAWRDLSKTSLFDKERELDEEEISRLYEEGNILCGIIDERGGWKEWIEDSKLLEMEREDLLENLRSSWSLWKEKERSELLWHILSMSDFTNSMDQDDNLQIFQLDFEEEGEEELPISYENQELRELLESRGKDNNTEELLRMLDQSSSILAGMEEEIGNLSSKNQELSNNRKHLKKQLKTLQEKYESELTKNTECVEIQTEPMSDFMDVAEVQTEGNFICEENEEEGRKKDEEIIELREFNTTLEMKVTNLMVEKDSLNCTIEDMTSDLSDLKESLKDALDLSNSAGNVTGHKMHFQNEKLKEKLRVEKEKLMTKEKEMNEMSYNYERWKKMHASLMEDLHDQNIAEIKRELAPFREMIRGKIDDMRKEKNDLLLMIHFLLLSCKNISPNSYQGITIRVSEERNEEKEEMKQVEETNDEHEELRSNSSDILSSSSELHQDDGQGYKQEVEVHPGGRMRTPVLPNSISFNKKSKNGSVTVGDARARSPVPYDTESTIQSLSNEVYSVIPPSKVGTGNESHPTILDSRHSSPLHFEKLGKEGNGEEGPTIISEGRSVSAHELSKWIQDRIYTVEDGWDSRKKEWERGVEEMEEGKIVNEDDYELWTPVKYEVENFEQEFNILHQWIHDFSQEVPPLLNTIISSISQRSIVSTSESRVARWQLSRAQAEICEFREGQGLFGNMPSTGETMDALAVQVMNLVDKIKLEREENEVLMRGDQSGELETMEELFKEQSELQSLKEKLVKEDENEELTVRISMIDDEISRNQRKISLLFQKIERFTYLSKEFCYIYFF